MDNRKAPNQAEKRISKKRQEEIAEKLLLEQNEGTFDFDFTTEESKYDEDKGGAEVTCIADLTEEEWTGNAANRMHNTAHRNTDTDINTDAVMMREEESENMIIPSSTSIDIDGDGDGGSYDEQDNDNGKQLCELTATATATATAPASSSSAIGEAAECSLNAMDEAAECSLNAIDEAAECSLNAMDEAAEASAPMLLFDEEVRVIRFYLLLPYLLSLISSILYYHTIYWCDIDTDIGIDFEFL